MLCASVNMLGGAKAACPHRVLERAEDETLSGTDTVPATLPVVPAGEASVGPLHQRQKTKRPAKGGQPAVVWQFLPEQDKRFGAFGQTSVSVEHMEHGYRLVFADAALAQRCLSFLGDIDPMDRWALREPTIVVDLPAAQRAATIVENRNKIVVHQALERIETSN